MGELTLGMNPAEVRDFAQAVDAAAKTLGEVRTTLTGKLGSTPWDGPDAASFRSAWSSTHAPSLASAVAALEAAATTARSNADAQEKTSDGGAGGGGGAGPGGDGDGGSPVSGGRLGSSLPTNRSYAGGWTENTFTNGQGSAEAGWGLDAKYGTSGALGTATYSAAGESGVGAKAWVQSEYGMGSMNATDNDPLAQRDASSLYDKRVHAGDGDVSVSKQGLHASVGAGAEAGAWSKGQASIHNGGLIPSSAAANYDALVGARAQAGASGALSLTGAQLGAQADAFAGGRVDGGASFDTGGIGAGATAGVSYGIGANAGAGLSLGGDGFHVSANLGVTFGLGANVKVNFAVNPADIPGAHLVSGAVGDVVHSGAAASVVHHLNPLSW